jgi:hypothetical protein
MRLCSVHSQAEFVTGGFLYREADAAFEVHAGDFVADKSLDSKSIDVVCSISSGRYTYS